MLPAPAAVPVERFVGIGFVRPFTDRPASGVCASVSSRPDPPRRTGFRAFVAFAFALFTPAFAAFFLAGFVTAFRPLEAGFFRLPLVFRADARGDFLAGFLAAAGLFRLTAFLAMVGALVRGERS